MICRMTSPYHHDGIPPKRRLHYTKKLSFPLRTSSVNVTKSEGTVDLVTFTEEMLNRKVHFLCSVNLLDLNSKPGINCIKTVLVVQGCSIVTSV